MQAENLTPQIVPLPEPSLPERYLFEAPMVPAVVLAIAAIVLFFILNARGKLRAGAIAAVVLLALAGGLWAMAASVVTPREALISRAREVVDATATADTAALRPMLAEGVEVRVGGQLRYTRSGRDIVLGLVEEYPGGSASIESHRLAEWQAVIDGPGAARTQLRLRHSGAGVPSASWWRLHWRRDAPDSPWIVDRIEPLWLAGIGNF